MHDPQTSAFWNSRCDRTVFRYVIFPITYVQNAYVILPYVNRTSLYDENNNQLCVTKLHKSQHWMCHRFSQTQTIKRQVLVTVNAQEMSLFLQNVIAFLPYAYRTRTVFCPITYRYSTCTLFRLCDAVYTSLCILWCLRWRCVHLGVAPCWNLAIIN